MDVWVGWFQINFSYPNSEAEESSFCFRLILSSATSAAFRLARPVVSTSSPTTSLLSVSMHMNKNNILHVWTNTVHIFSYCVVIVGVLANFFRQPEHRLAPTGTTLPTERNICWCMLKVTWRRLPPVRHLKQRRLSFLMMKRSRIHFWTTKNIKDECKNKQMEQRD